MGQTCRVCGVCVASGFTNCDACYYKSNEAKIDEIKLLKHISKLGILGVSFMRDYVEFIRDYTGRPVNR